MWKYSLIAALVLLVSAIWVARGPSPRHDSLSRHLQQALVNTRSELDRPQRSDPARHAPIWNEPAERKRELGQRAFRGGIAPSSARATRVLSAPAHCGWGGPSS